MGELKKKNRKSTKTNKLQIFILGGNEAESDTAIAGGSEDSGTASGTFGKSEPTKTLQCDICMAKLKNARSYIVHMKRHAGTINLRCRLCPEIFQGNMKLKKHMRTVHGPDTVNLNPIVMEEEDEDDSQSSTTSSTASNAKTVSNLTPILPTATSTNTIVPQSPVVVDLPGPPIGEPKSGRTSTASSSMEERSVSGSTRLSADNSTIKCALCPETFSDSAALQAHTLAHFDGGSADALLREKLLKSTKKKHKKKKRKKREQSIETIPPVLETVPSEGMK